MGSNPGWLNLKIHVLSFSYQTAMDGEKRKNVRTTGGEEDIQKRGEEKNRKKTIRRRDIYSRLR